MSKKYKLFLLVAILISIISVLFYLSFYENIIIGSTSIGPENAFSAEKINNIGDLINLLLETESFEEREKLMEENKALIINEDFLETLSDVYCNTFYHNNENLLKMEKIGIELAEFTDDKSILAGLLLDYGWKNSDDRGEEKIERAISLYKEIGDLDNEAYCYFELSDLYHSQYGQAEKAFEPLDKAMELYKETGNIKNISMCYSKKGALYRFLGENEEAIKNIEKSLELYRDIKDDEGIISCFHVLSMIYQYEGLMEKGEEALLLRENAIEEGVFNDPLYTKEFEMMSNYTLLGHLYKNMGRYEKAIKYFKKELLLTEEIDMAGVSLGYTHLGDIYKIIGQKEVALNYYLSALKSSENLLYIPGKEEEGNRFDNSSYYITLGLFYLDELKDPDEARKYFEQSRNISQRLKDDVFKEQHEADYFWLFAKVDEAEGYFNSAVEKMEKCREIYERLYERDRWQRRNLLEVYRQCGKIYEKKGDSGCSFDYLCKAFEASSSFRELSDSYKDLGDFYFRKGEFGLAEENYKKSLKEVEGLLVPSILWKCHFSLGKVYEKLDNLSEAYNAYNKAIEIIENMRNDFQVDEIKRDFMKDKIEVYEYMIDLLIRMKKEEEAFNFNEKARGRAFLDILANQKVDIFYGLSPQLQKKEAELKNQIQHLLSNVTQEKSKDISEQRSIFLEKSNKKIQSLQFQYKDIIEQIKLENSEYMTFISVSPFELKDIQSFLDKDTAIFEYFLTEDRVYLWIIGSEEFNTVIIEKNRDEIEELIRDYREIAFENMTIEKLESNEWQNYSKKLYNILFKGGEKFISGKERVIISPHRILHYLPFHTLIDDKGKTLIEKFEVSYLPSSSILKFCQEKNTLTKDRLLAFQLGNFKVGNFSPLPGTEKELVKIKDLFPECEVYSEVDMKKEVLKNIGKDYDILHFATHGILEPDAPLFSSLIFADRPLNVYEIFGLDLSASLITLSACRTALSEDANGDELIGLSRAFICAGSPSICSSLWSVSDESTGELMERFYFHLREMNKSEALKRAQIDLMKKYEHPFFWAPFILIGDWR